jgi:hypothetical protein
MNKDVEEISSVTTKLDFFRFNTALFLYQSLPTSSG